MTKKLLLIGGGGHCTSVLDTLLTNDDYDEIGIIDTVDNIGRKLLGISFIGCDSDLINLYNSGYTNAFITIGSIGDAKLRIKKYKELKQLGFNIPNIIDNTAIVSKFSQLEEGVFIGKYAVVNANAKIDNSAIINTRAIIEHDCSIGAFSHVAPGAVLCGNVSIGMNTHIGANSVIRQDINVGSNNTIGTGSNVVKNMYDNMIAFGNPCKEVQK